MYSLQVEKRKIKRAKAELPPQQPRDSMANEDELALEITPFCMPTHFHISFFQFLSLATHDFARFCTILHFFALVCVISRYRTCSFLRFWSLPNRLPSHNAHDSARIRRQRITASRFHPPRCSYSHLRCTISHNFSLRSHNFSRILTDSHYFSLFLAISRSGFAKFAILQRDQNAVPCPTNY